jgi:hypothetical protein
VVVLLDPEAELLGLLQDFVLDELRVLDRADDACSRRVENSALATLTGTTL